MVTVLNFNEFTRAHELALGEDLKGAQELSDRSLGQRYGEADGIGVGEGKVQQRHYQNFNR